MPVQQRATTGAEIYLYISNITNISVPQVLQWTLRKATSSVCGPLQFGKCLLSSSSSQNTLLSSQHNDEAAPVWEKPVTELSQRSLVVMGFTDTQAEQIYDSVSKIRGGFVAKHALSSLTALFVMGLNPSSVLKLLKKCPELYTVKESQLQQRIDNLRKLGLVEGEVIIFDIC